MTADQRNAAKVPAVTLGFWVVKVLATTLGETGGDTVTMQLGLGYLVGTAIFLSLLVVFVAWQIAARRFYPLLYWATILASTTAGTTMADFADRSLGIGYTGGSALLLALVLGTLAAWRWTMGSIDVSTVRTPRAEAFYWAAITFSQTLGTALGDWAADDGGLGFGGGALVFGGALAVLAALYYRTALNDIIGRALDFNRPLAREALLVTGLLLLVLGFGLLGAALALGAALLYAMRTSSTGLFWAAFILTRPLGATVGDLLDKPVAEGGFALSRALATAVLAGAIVLLLIVLPQHAAEGEAAH